MELPEDTAERIIAALAVLPPPAQAKAMRAAINRAIKPMSVYRILEIRQRIVSELDPENPEVFATLQMIDGQIMLREIAGARGWR